MVKRLIEYSYYILFFFVPLVLTPINYELFEYNKMMITYGLTAIITGSWIINMIITKRFNIKRTPLDVPILLFLASQIVSTYLSIDRHVSIWGYYSRFNGGLISTISYILLYFAFVANFPREKIGKLLKVILFSGFLVAVYGILERLGVDKDIWVQDVQNRVFSTLGQPNWLAAYLAVLIPISLGLGLSSITNLITDSKGKIQNSKFKIQKQNVNILSIGLLAYLFIGLLFYVTLIFTKSRSGFLGFWVADIIFLCLILIRFKKELIKAFVICNLSFVILTFLFGAPFDQINRFTLPQVLNNQRLPANDQQPIKPTGGSVIDIGITESGTIRQIVWRGAVDIFRHFPIFGTGVETFAFAYYKFRPAEHNMTSEWDFLYNKAHNEYLNYAATTGTFGLGSYLLIIFVFIGWNLKSSITYHVSRIKYKENKIIPNTYYVILNTSLFVAWLSILVTNFFGFSVVIIQLFFFLIPAISFVLSNNNQPTTNNQQLITKFQYFFCLIVALSVLYIWYSLARIWYADVLFADGYHRSRSEDSAASYQMLKKALEVNDNEPVYYDEFSYPAAILAVGFADEKQATLSGILTKEAIIASNFAIGRSPQNINFWKSRTRVFYALSQIDEKYFTDALSSLQQAKLLSPTDPKVKYNLALMYDRIGKKEESIKELLETTKLKADYKDAFYALAYIYEKDNKRDLAREALKYILTKISTDDAEVKKKLEELN